MRPVGTAVLLGPADNLKPRDIITFRQEGETHPTTHTFIGYGENGSLMTKGDANLAPDVHIPALTTSDVMGKVTYAITPQRLIGCILLLLAALLLMPSYRKSEESA